MNEDEPLRSREHYEDLLWRRSERARVLAIQRIQRWIHPNERELNLTLDGPWSPRIAHVDGYLAPTDVWAPSHTWAWRSPEPRWSLLGLAEYTRYLGTVEVFETVTAQPGVLRALPTNEARQAFDRYVRARIEGDARGSDEVADRYLAFLRTLPDGGAGVFLESAYTRNYLAGGVTPTGEAIKHLSDAVGMAGCPPQIWARSLPATRSPSEHVSTTVLATASIAEAVWRLLQLRPALDPERTVFNAAVSLRTRNDPTAEFDGLWDLDAGGFWSEEMRGQAEHLDTEAVELSVGWRLVEAGVPHSSRCRCSI